jgi:hypothetical protein
MKQKTHTATVHFFILGFTLLLLVSCALIPGLQAAVTPVELPTETIQPSTPTALNGTTESPTSTPLPSATPLSSTTPTPSATPTPVTQVAVITPDSQVRRLTPAVFAGKNQPLPELKTDDIFSLAPGSQISTDKSGQAEVILANCLKLFIFQDSSLVRRTCRKEDAASGLAVCGTAGMTSVLNQCTSQVNIQTISSNVKTEGTWFSVIYLPADQISIVQVYEGAVDVRAVTDTQNRKMTGGQKIGAGSLWFTSPGADAPFIGGIEGRQPQPMEVWEGLRSELINKYPDLDLWIRSARDRAKLQKLNFPDNIVAPAGKVTIHLVGAVWTENRLQDALLLGVPWRQTVRNLWQNFDITPQIEFPKRVIQDARGRKYDPGSARKTLSGTGVFSDPNTPITLAVNASDAAAQEYAYDFQSYLSEIGLNAELQQMSGDELKKTVQSAETGGYGRPFIWINSSGEAFTNF